MATVSRIVKVRNPRRAVKRRTVTRTAKRKSSVKRRSSGPAIHRYNVKQLKKELKRRGVKSNPTRRAAIRRRKAVRRSVKRNPVLIELGMVNPTRRKSVAKTRRKTRRTRRTVARNPRSHSKRVTRVVRTHRRRRVGSVARTTRRRRNGRVHRRRNPALFGQSGGRGLLTMVGGGLVGVAASKFIPGLLPTSVRSSLGSSPIMSVLLTGAGAYAASMLAKKVAGPVFGEAVLFGGLMQTGSVAINAFMPSASQLALSGMGAIVDGWYPVPQNPILGTGQPPVAIMPAPSQGMGNMRRWGNFR